MVKKVVFCYELITYKRCVLLISKLDQKNVISLTACIFSVLLSFLPKTEAKGVSQNLLCSFQKVHTWFGPSLPDFVAPLIC